MESLIKFNLAHRKKEGGEEEGETLSTAWFKTKIDKVEDEWNAAKYKERQRSYELNDGVSMRAEKGLAGSQREEGEEVKTETQQPIPKKKHN